MHRIYASLNKAKVILAKEKNFKASVEEILKKISKKTKIVFITILVTSLERYLFITKDLIIKLF